MVVLFANTINSMQKKLAKKTSPQISWSKKISSEDTDHMPNNIKNIKFTMGISDYDRKKGRRMPGACSFNGDAVFVFHDARVRARLTHVVH